MEGIYGEAVENINGCSRSIFYHRTCVLVLFYVKE